MPLGLSFSKYSVKEIDVVRSLFSCLPREFLPQQKYFFIFVVCLCYLRHLF